jgi:hypothetical protein
MKDLINIIETTTKNQTNKYTLKSDKLTTKIHSTTSLFHKELIEFTTAFNKLFKNNKDPNNTINNYIIENDNLFEEAESVLNNNDLITTKALDAFNIATRTTSKAKCDKEKEHYIMKCYEYFIYIFDKSQNKSYMLIKKDIKVLTMINILLLTPYLMYGELFAVHGGLISKDKKNILINNASLGGKTTFAILFASNGWDIITEETTYITTNGEILPFNIRNYFNIRVGTYLNFLDFFKSKNIIFNDFISMNKLSSNELYNLGKKDQKSIEFEKIGTFKELENKCITDTLKVALKKDEPFKMIECSKNESVDAFLNLSLAPTVLLFTELLNFDIKDKETRKKQLEEIFMKTNSFEINSGFDYKNHFKEILKNI